MARRSEDGFTLVEMMIGLSLALLVLTAAAAILVEDLKSESRASSRASGIQRARTAVERMTRELRQGKSVSVATAGQLSVVTWVASASCGGAAADTAILCRVTYSCSADACTRSVGPADGSNPGSPEQIVTGLSSPSIFSYAPSPGAACSVTTATAPHAVCVTLAFPSSDGVNAITLTDGVTLRNA